MYDLKYHTGELDNCSFLITGGAGFIGSNIVEYLLRYKAKKVRVLDDFSTGFYNNIAAFLDNPAFELIRGDIRDLPTCRNAVKGIDYIAHQAALGSVPRSLYNPVTTNEVNISGHLNMLVASRDEGCKRMVYAASSSTYGDHPTLPKIEHVIGRPLSPYAITKYVNELYGDIFSSAYDFHTVGLRYFNIFGPRQSPTGEYAAVIPLFIKAAINNETIIINGDGQTSRDFTFVENAVQANIKALLLPELTQHQIYNVACGEQTTLNGLVEMLKIISGNTFSVSYGFERKGDVKHSKASIDKIEQQLNYKPVVKFKQGLQIVYHWYKDNL